MEKKGTRKIDELGRLVIPADIRKSFNINAGDSVELFVDYSQNSIIIKKYNDSCSLCGSKTDLVQFNDQFVCYSCINKISSLR